MSLRLRLMLVLLAVYSAGSYYLVRQLLQQARPQQLGSIEQSLADISALLASLIEQDSTAGDPQTRRLQDTAAAVLRRQSDPAISAGRETWTDLRICVVDTQGRVVFGEGHGADLSHRTDIAASLNGEYGARWLDEDPGGNHAPMLHVAAPIRGPDGTLGAVSVGKSTNGIDELLATTRRRLLLAALAGGVALLAGLWLAASWVTAPLERLTAYAREVRDGRKAARPPLPGRTLQVLGTAFEEMRDALEGRQHVERYTQALAHEIKAPLAAIRAAAELLDEEMPAAQRGQFIANIRSEVSRTQQILERLLELSLLEARKALRRTEPIAAAELMHEAAGVMAAAFSTGGIELANTLVGEATMVQGDRVLLREALVNLLQNALDFSARGGVVRFAGRVQDGQVTFTVEDSGPGVPDYALARVFDRFYSLPRPGSTRKSTGLGLPLVREIAHLHGGDASLENRPEGGARAAFWIPLWKGPPMPRARA